MGDDKHTFHGHSTLHPSAHLNVSTARTASDQPICERERSRRRRRKEAEEMKRSEEKAERENYTAWVQVRALAPPHRAAGRPSRRS